MNRYVEVYPIHAPNILVKRVKITGKKDKLVEKIERELTINTDLSEYAIRIVDRPIVKNIVNKKMSDK